MTLQRHRYFKSHLALLALWNSSEGKFKAKKTTMQIDNRKKMVYAFMRPKNLKLHIMMK